MEGSEEGGGQTRWRRVIIMTSAQKSRTGKMRSGLGGGGGGGRVDSRRAMRWEVSYDVCTELLKR